MAGLPLLKLGGLLLRTITKPLAKRLEARVKQSENFKDLFVRFGRGANHFQVVISRQLMGLQAGTVHEAVSYTHLTLPTKA